MISYMQFDAVVPGATPSGLVPDALDEGITFIPGLSVLLDPEYAGPGGVLNRVSGGMLSPPTPWTGDNIGVLPGGRPAFDVQNTTANRIPSDVAINPNSWTAFFVINATSTEVSGARNLIAPEVLTGAGIGLRITLRTTGQLSIYPTAASTPRLTVSAAAIPAAQTFLLMATGDTEDGLRIFVNGAQVAHDATKTEPLDDQIGPGQYSFYRNNSGTGDLLGGLTGLTGFGLGQTDAVTTAYRRALERVLMDRYSIA